MTKRGIEDTDDGCNASSRTRNAVTYETPQNRNTGRIRQTRYFSKALLTMRLIVMSSLPKDVCTWMRRSRCLKFASWIGIFDGLPSSSLLKVFVYDESLMNRSIESIMGFNELESVQACESLKETLVKVVSIYSLNNCALPAGRRSLLAKLLRLPIVRHSEILPEREHFWWPCAEVVNKDVASGNKALLWIEFSGSWASDASRIGDQRSCWNVFGLNPFKELVYSSSRFKQGVKDLARHCRWSFGSTGLLKQRLAEVRGKQLQFETRLLGVESVDELAGIVNDIGLGAGWKGKEGHDMESVMRSDGHHQRA
ncbi:hypothetical protein CPB85DRAFT_1255714 [Mucidula mucida]|nr:hypothetical protein CPB85DRAFT_1255714 [Mucidula mucida]